MVDAKTKQILATSSTNGKKYDFRQFKELKVCIKPSKKIRRYGLSRSAQDTQKYHNSAQKKEK